ncbi:molybdopterin biosynthesis protein MoeY [Paucibacter sp. APW11]|uniref:Molybdopterin biosynthesis protein MoeY n=1 Tax=Roseateles aquae TaxID=3077235 RepID=A0ABU3P5U9_9BURK|nr:molybdopterin biosynthesis protein MoeY [Paucibacter sp. APW11]MDT8997955.1 molybdopterin biosynthesis protein MoeY [Paucibacter sp. APW11]
MSTSKLMEEILDLARWAPSGDNTQPWRFEPLAPDHLRIHAFDTRDHCVYDLDGHPSQISIGTLIETISIAASRHGLRLEHQRRGDAPDDPRPVFDIRFIQDRSVKPDPLADFIKERRVQRRPMQRRLLSEAEKSSLEASVMPRHRVHWISGPQARLRVAKLLFHSAHLRLTIPEAYQVHRDVIEWHAQFSKDRIPDQALGASPMTVLMMRQVMKSWERVHFFNRFLAGTWAARIELDFIPSLACASHFLLIPPHPATSIEDYVEAGRSIQRFWLTAAQLNLQLQPEVTPLVFGRYARERREFSARPGATAEASDIRRRLQKLVGEAAADAAVFMGRVGQGKPASARSTRKDLADLMISSSARQ